MSRPNKKSKAETGNHIRITYKYQAYPTDLQIYRVENLMGSLCHLSNQSVAERKEANPAYTTQDCSSCGYSVPKTLAERVHTCPQCGLSLCRDTNAARNIEQLAFGEESAYAEAVGSNTAGTVYPKLVPVLSEQTPVETGGSAGPALAVSPVVEAGKTRLMLHLSSGSSRILKTA